MLNPSKISTFNSLHFKIALFVISTTLITFGAYSALQLTTHRRTFLKAERESTELLGRALTSSLEIAMLHSDTATIRHSFHEASRDKNIVRIFLLNREMQIRVSSDPEMVGRFADRSETGCIECHSSTSGGQIPTSAELPGDAILRVVVPIINKPLCYRCHDSGLRLNGILILDRSLKATKEELYAGIQRAALIAGLFVLAMLLLFRWFIKRQIINRVAYLESLARRVADNELDLNIELAGKDELSSLASSFNNMKAGLRIAMEELKVHRNYLGNLLNNLIDGIIIVDDHDKIVFVNESFFEVLEIDPESAAPGDDAGHILYSDLRLAGIEDFVTSARRRGSSFRDTIRLHLPGGKEKNLEIHAGYLILPPRREPEVIIVIRDITTIIAYEKQVYQSDKLATVGRLAAGVAHEINNPMASILTCAEGLLKMQSGIDHSTNEYLAIIRNSARRCKLITQKLLDYSAASDLRRETLDLHQILKEALTLLHFEASKKHIEIRISETVHFPPLQGSKDALVQVFVNLVLNSIQAVEEGGKIEIYPSIEDDLLTVTINDNGSGISPENRSRVFEPFFTTKPIGSGTGLGLSVSQGIIRRHSGHIEIVESRPGHTSIKVSLPVIFEEGSIFDQ